MHAIHCIRSNLAYKLAFGNRSRKKTCLYHNVFPDNRNPFVAVKFGFERVRENDGMNILNYH